MFSEQSKKAQGGISHGDGGISRISHRRLQVVPAVNDSPESHGYPRILLIDDDPGFGKIIERTAAKLGIVGPDDIKICSTLTDFSRLADFDFDVVIMDYDLGDITGFDVTRHIEHLTSTEIPVILVSHSRHEKPECWPRSIQGFVHKGMGPYAVLSATFEVCVKHRRRRRIA